MNLNRRNVLIGIATVAMITGAALGSGAFTTVEADRALNIDTAADDSANIGLVANSTLVNTTSGGGNSEDILNINLNSLNDDAITTLAPAFDVENNMGQDIELTVSSLPTGVSMDVGGTNISSAPVTVTSGDKVLVDMEIDSTQAVDGTSTTITIEATTDT